ncbi:MAG: GGDEF domain-containing protein [Acidobacteria bacterium]|nr:GGDEF domain-containing protein [Acidobacteriota bacterium]
MRPLIRVHILFLLLLPAAALSLAEEISTPSAEEIQRLTQLTQMYKEKFTSDPQEAIHYAAEALELALRHDQHWEIIDILTNLGSLSLTVGDQDKALDYYLQADDRVSHFMIRAPEIDFRERAKKMRSTILQRLGDVYLGRQQFGESLARYEAALELEGSGGRQRILLSIHQQIGYIYLLTGEYDCALEHSLSAIRLAESLDDKSRMADNAYLIGYIHRNLRKFSTALEYFQLSARLAREASHRSRLANALNEIGNVHGMQGNIEAGMRLKMEALKIAEEIGDRYTQAACLNDIGTLLVRQKKYPLALTYFQRSYAIDLEIGQYREIIGCLSNIAMCYALTGRPEEAKLEIQKCIDLAREKNLNFELLNSLEGLSMTAYQLEEYKLAADNIYEAYHLKDEIYDQQSHSRLTELQAQYDTERKEKQIQLLRNNLTIQELETEKEFQAKRLLLAGIGVLLVVMLLVFRQYRHKTLSNRIIRTKNRELQVAYEQLDRTARLDPLTELANRRDVLERLEIERRRCARNGRPFCLVLADIDSFKAINDQHGHDCGDAVLVSLAAKLRAAIRKQDTVARWGGEEFLLLLPETGSEGGRTLAEKIRVAVHAEPFRYKEMKISLSITCGVAEHIPDESLDDCLKRADQALYMGKRDGKNCVVTAQQPDVTTPESSLRPDVNPTTT